MMQISRIVSFGCSITFGHGLPDCFEPPTEPGSVASQYAWPSLLASELGVGLDNKSKCGSSNLEILTSVLTYKFQEGDVAIIMWSFKERDLLFGKKSLFGKQQMAQIGIWQKTDTAKKWFDVHTDEDLAVRSWFNVHHATCYLENNSIPFYNTFVMLKDLEKYKPTFLNAPYYDIRMNLSMPKDLALDKRHPGIKTHTLIANRIKNILKVKNEN